MAARGERETGQRQEVSSRVWEVAGKLVGTGRAHPRHQGLCPPSGTLHGVLPVTGDSHPTRGRAGTKPASLAVSACQDLRAALRGLVARAFPCCGEGQWRSSGCLLGAPSTVAHALGCWQEASALPTCSRPQDARGPLVRTADVTLSEGPGRRSQAEPRVPYDLDLWPHSVPPAPPYGSHTGAPGWHLFQVSQAGPTR